MASVNKVIIVGNLGRGPEIRYMPSGDAIANIAVATSYKSKDRQTGEQKELTEWHRISFFGRLAEICCEYLHKGSKVYIEGQLQTRKWQNQQGQDQYSTEVVLQGFNGVLTMLDGRSGGASGMSEGGGDSYDAGGFGNYDEPKRGSGGAKSGGGGASYDKPLDDEIPF